MLSKENLRILTNIIGAVESGGQVYGQRKYNAYAAPYTNTPKEHTITLGWAQNYGAEAQKLIQMIYDMSPSEFKAIDSNGAIYNALKGFDWVSKKWNPTADQKKTLIAIIDSPTGHECQDQLFEQLMTKFVADCESTYTKDVPAVMMYCQIRHLGEKAPTDRIFKRLNGNYSLDNIMASLTKDQNDTSSDNQVGDRKFWSRHVKCYEFIQRYVVDAKIQNDGGNTMAKTKTDKAIEWMEATAADPSHGYDQVYRWGEKGDYDCSASVITAWQQAGVPVKSNGATYTGDMKKVFLRTGFTDVTNKVNIRTGSGLKRGDVLLREFHHTGMYCGNGKEVEAGLNEKGTTTGGKPGDQTGSEFLIRDYRGSYWADGCVLRYSESATTSAPKSTSSGSVLKKGSKGSDVRAMQKKLINCGFSCGPDGADGDFGAGTEKAVKTFQKYKSIEVDGEYGPISKKALSELEQSLLSYTRYTTHTKSHVNFRSSAEYGENVIGKAYNGDCFVFLNSTKGSWLRCRFNGKDGYVNGNYVVLKK